MIHTFMRPIHYKVITQTSRADSAEGRSEHITEIAVLDICKIEEFL